jgi:hypothetical protein
METKIMDNIKQINFLRGRIDANNTIAYLCQNYDKEKALSALFENQSLSLELKRLLEL